jgi:hypothetical protein
MASPTHEFRCGNLATIRRTGKLGFADQASLIAALIRMVNCAR